MSSVIRIGSRESRLAVIQAEIVKELIQKNHPEIQVELVTMKTTGDKILDKSLELIGGKGLFVKELDKALLEGSIDISVHSLKDMPMEIPEESAYCRIQQTGRSKRCADLQAGMRRGSRKRRYWDFQQTAHLQLGKLYPGCTFRGIRGNVQTRLRKLEEEGYDGTILAAAGLSRLNMEHVIGRIFSTEEMVPAAGQGILAVQGRKGEDHSFLDCVESAKSRSEALAEREFVAALDGGCTSPVAAHAEANGSELKLTGLYYREEDDTYWTETRIGNTADARQLGAALAEDMRRRD